MMKIGCNYLSLPDLDVESFIRTAYDLRLDVIDFHRRAFTTNDPAYLLGIKRLCLELGLPIGYIGVSNSFVGDDAQLQAEIEKCAVGCDYYAENGAAQLADEMIESDASRSIITYQPRNTIASAIGKMKHIFVFNHIGCNATFHLAPVAANI